MKKSFKTIVFVLIIGIVSGLSISCANQLQKDKAEVVQQKKTIVSNRYDITYQNNEKIIADKQNQVVWQGTIPQKALLWQEAIDYCNNLEYGGYSDWRLPTLKELKSLIVGCSAIENCGFDESCKDDKCFTKDCNGCERNMCEGPGENGNYWQKGIWGESFCGEKATEYNCYWSSFSLSNEKHGLFAVMVVNFSVANLSDTPMFDEDKDSSMSLVRCAR